MGDLTHNLSASEFSCRCKYDDCNLKEVAHYPLVIAIQEGTDHFANKYGTRAKVEITGPNRCRKHNEDENGAEHSTHIDAIAADHKIYVFISGGWHQIPPNEQYDYYDKKYPTSHGIGLYKTRVHLDTRKHKARW